MKKVLRKRLKEDEFVSTLTKIFEFGKKRIKEISIGIGAVLVILLVVLISNVIKAQSVKKDSRLLAEILAISDQLENDPGKLAELEALAGNGKFSRIGYLKLASYWIGQGDMEKAKSYLEQMPDNRKDITYYQGMDMLAQIYIGNSEYDKAIAIYESIEEGDENDYPPDAVLFHKAEAYEGKGELDSALELFKRVRDEYSQTYYGMDASEKVTEIEAKK